MRKLAVVALAGALAVGVASPSWAGHRHHGGIGPAAVFGLFAAATLAAAASQPHYHYYYEPYPAYPPPAAYYAYPPPVVYAPRKHYYSDSWCSQLGSYNPSTGIVVEANGSTWQCGRR